jgi:hypothetical protein
MDEQSVSAMIPMRIFGCSGASDAHAPPRHPAGTPARTAAATDVFTNSRRLSRICTLLGLKTQKAPCLDFRHQRLVTRMATMAARCAAKVQRACHSPRRHGARGIINDDAPLTRAPGGAAVGPCRNSEQPGGICPFSRQQ